MAETLLDDLVDMLRLEREMIRSGDFGALNALAERKESLLRDLVGAPVTGLERIRAMAEENQRILNAALKGVRAAQRRWQMIRDASKALNSYDPQGRARTIRPDGTGSLERRA